LKKISFIPKCLKAVQFWLFCHQLTGLFLHKPAIDLRPTPVLISYMLPDAHIFLVKNQAIHMRLRRDTRVKLILPVFSKRLNWLI